MSRISSIHFRNFKAFADFSVSLGHSNVLVGPNNCGKSTILSALRALEVGLQRARSRSSERLGDFGWGYRITPDTLPLSLENVHTDYSDIDTSVEFKLHGGNRLKLLFPADGGCILRAETKRNERLGPKAFQNEFPATIAAVPVLGPVEHNEEILGEDYVRRSLNTHRASRHFRNYWYHYPQNFDEFRTLLAATWPEMDIEPPTCSIGIERSILTMMGIENRVPRELYWSGFGFQVWCQLLTHLVRGSKSSLVVIDEPEIYLHPDIQRH